MAVGRINRMSWNCAVTDVAVDDDDGDDDESADGDVDDDDDDDDDHQDHDHDNGDDLLPSSDRVLVLDFLQEHCW